MTVTTRALRRKSSSNAKSLCLAAGLALSTLHPLMSEISAQQATPIISRASTTTTQQKNLQPAEQKSFGSRRFKYIGIGAAIGLALAFGYDRMSANGQRGSDCAPKSCALPYLTITGAVSGMFMAHEIDAQKKAEAPRTGMALTFSSRDFELPAPPTAIAISDTLVAAVTDSGAQLLGARGGSAQRRGAGLSDLRSVAIAGNGTRLLIGTGSALWESPVAAGLLKRVVDGPVDALGSSNDVTVSASGRMLHINSIRDGAARTDSLDAGAIVTATTRDAATGHWWVTSDSTLFELALGTASPVLTPRAKLDGQARAVTANSNWIAVALGSNGIAVWPHTAFENGVTPAPMLLRGEPRMAFDLAFANGSLFVAAGVDGIYQVTVGGADMIVKGVSRQIGYATSIVTDGKVLWVADRSRNRVVRIVP